MCAALARLQEWRSVEMRDAERPEVGDDCRGGIESEVGGQLQAIGRNRNGRRHQDFSMYQNTDHGAMASPGVEPQILVPPGLTGTLMDCLDKFASNRSVVPSLIFQFDESRPSS